MRFFQYTAEDGGQYRVQAMIQASSPEEARQRLASQGLSVIDLHELGGSATVVPLPPAPAATRPSGSSAPPGVTPRVGGGQTANSPRSPQAPAAPRVNPTPTRTTAATTNRATPVPKVQVAPTPLQVSAPAPRISVPSALPSSPQRGEETAQTAVTSDVVATRPGKDWLNHLLFVQLAAYFRSGVNPVQALSTLGAAHRRPEYRAALMHASEAVGRGEAMSKALARYPDLFPPDLAATMKVGEESGQLSLACDDIAQRALDSHKIKRRMFYFTAVACLAATLVPIITAVVRGSLNSVSRQWEADGQLPVGKTLGQEVAPQLLQMLPIVVLIAAGLLLGYRLWNSRRLRSTRHFVSLRTPFLGGRARAEALHRFTWSMAVLARTGRTPRDIVALSADTIPNDALRAEFQGRTRGMGESERISSVFNEMPMLPPQYRDMAETGEITGDVAGMMGQISQLSELEYRSKNDTIVWKMSLVIYPILGGLIAIAVAKLYTLYVSGLIQRIQ